LNSFAHLCRVLLLLPMQLALKNFILFSCILKRDRVTTDFLVSPVSLINESCHFELLAESLKGIFGGILFNTASSAAPQMLR
jgi:hypothetical protein